VQVALAEDLRFPAIRRFVTGLSPLACARPGSSLFESGVLPC
jgi:hypothetical protein